MSDVALSEEQLIERLFALAAHDGLAQPAAKALTQAGTPITKAELLELQAAHAGMYQAIAVERARTQEETIAQNFREITLVGQRVTKHFLADLAEDMENGTLDHNTKRSLPQIVQALAKVQQVSTDKLLAITGRPQDGSSHDPLAATRELVRMGVLVPVARPAVDITAEEAP